MTKRFSYEEKNNDGNSKRLILSAVVFVLVVAVFIIFLVGMKKGDTGRQMELLEKAVNNDITFCYTVEGKYPPDTQYLKEKYGLTYDENRFFVDIIDYGENIRPEVTIIELEK